MKGQDIKYILRNIPIPLWEKVRAAAEKQRVSIRVWLLWAMKEQLYRMEGKAVPTQEGVENVE